MEHRINKLIPIVGVAIFTETIIFILYLYERALFWYIFLSFIITYILMLISAKRVGFFDKTSFLQALLYALLMSAPVIALPFVLGLFYNQLIRHATPITDWMTVLTILKTLATFSFIKFVFVCIIAFIFCTRLESFTGLSDEKELGLYGTTIQGVICRKWQHRHLRFVRAEYHINGKRYETDSKIDRKNLFSENDTVTVLYSTRYPLISMIKELADQDLT